MRFLSYPKIETEIDAYIIFHMCRNPIFGAYVLVVGSIVAIVNPISRNLLQTATQWIVFVSIASFSFILFFAAFALVGLTIASMSGRDHIRSAPIVLVSSLFCQFMADIVGKYLMGNSGGTRENLVVSFLIIFSISLAATSIYFLNVHKIVMVTYIEPDLPHDYNFRPQPSDPSNDLSTPTDYFIVAGKKYPIAKLLHIKAERNYVKISWENGSAFLRAKLSDVSAQLPSSVGIQIHRSCWVSRYGVLKVSNSGQIVTTKDNTEHTVARHRRAEIEAWLRVHGFRY